MTVSREDTVKYLLLSLHRTLNLISQIKSEMSTLYSQRSWTSSWPTKAKLFEVVIIISDLFQFGTFFSYLYLFCIKKKTIPNLNIILSQHLRWIYYCLGNNVRLLVYLWNPLPHSPFAVPPSSSLVNTNTCSSTVQSHITNTIRRT